VASKTHAKGQDLELLVEIAEAQADWIALDIATGGGHTALKFAGLVARVIATDITPKMLEEARGFIGESGAQNVAFGLADAEALPFEDSTVDLVTCRIAPHHFPGPKRFVCESARVLKSDGLLLVQDHVLPEDGDVARYVDGFERLRDPSHNRAYAESEWVGMFRAAGLEVERVELVVKRHQLVPWAKRQGCTAKTIATLADMIDHASEAVVEWMQPRDLSGAEASFANHHIIIAGRKPSYALQG
jgi:SAM-dependent methyltransferase